MEVEAQGDLVLERQHHGREARRLRLDGQHAPQHHQIGATGVFGQLDRPPAQVFAEVERAAAELGWDVTRSDPENGAIEAIDVTALFRFVDDIVVRVRPAENGSVVDLRSKSRDGRGDMGANAARIRAFRDRFSG